MERRVWVTNISTYAGRRFSGRILVTDGEGRCDAYVRGPWPIVWPHSRYHCSKNLSTVDCILANVSDARQDGHSKETHDLAIRDPSVRPPLDPLHIDLIVSKSTSKSLLSTAIDTNAPSDPSAMSEICHRSTLRINGVIGSV